MLNSGIRGVAGRTDADRRHGLYTAITRAEAGLVLLS
ncbi:hypothetical protein GGD88_003377 [Roseospira goensis]|uniref:Uncharacterized protein n=1 Tax=Roseospira goensis TaxID=391922 RepID=A0A7W6WM72_9PROT|nr:hypothetical protein [Roseospira goensis]